MAETPLKYRLVATVAWTFVCALHVLRFAIPVKTPVHLTTLAVRKALAFIQAA